MKISGIGTDTYLWIELNAQIKELGHEIIQVTTFDQGVRFLESDPTVDLIIVDTDSSNFLGRKLLNTISDKRKFKNIPVVVVGQSIQKEDVLDFHKFNLFDMIIIPTSNENLFDLLRRVKNEGKKRILVVDDEEIVCEALAGFLSLERYVPIITHSGEEALGMLKRYKISAVITDYLMSGMTGFDLLLHIKRNYPNIPVIMISGYSGIFQPEQIIKAGADGYFKKPFKNTELLIKLNEILTIYENKYSYF